MKKNDPLGFRHSMQAKGFVLTPHGWIKGSRVLKEGTSAPQPDKPSLEGRIEAAQRLLDLSLSPQKDALRLNKTEQAYLTYLHQQPTHSFVRVQGITLKLAEDCRYTPDFSSICNQRLHLHEVKGFMREDALIKLKVAARLHPYFNFYLIFRKNGTWLIKQILP